MALARAGRAAPSAAVPRSFSEPPGPRGDQARAVADRAGVAHAAELAAGALTDEALGACPGREVARLALRDARVAESVGPACETLAAPKAGLAAASRALPRDADARLAAIARSRALETGRARAAERDERLADPRCRALEAVVPEAGRDGGRRGIVDSRDHGLRAGSGIQRGPAGAMTRISRGAAIVEPSER